MFAYSDAEPARPNFEALLDRYFEDLVGYQVRGVVWCGVRLWQGCAFFWNRLCGLATESCRTDTVSCKSILQDNSGCL